MNLAQRGGQKCKLKVAQKLSTIHGFVNVIENSSIMFTPARDFLLETPWRIIIPNPNVNSHSL
jgi:hypothetical protein